MRDLSPASSRWMIFLEGPDLFRRGIEVVHSWLRDVRRPATLKRLATS